MKQTLFGAAIALCMVAMTIVGCKKTTDTIDYANADPITGGKTLYVGDTVQLSDALPNGSWASSDTTVATVSSAGLVTAMKGGTTVISYVVAVNDQLYTLYDSLQVQPAITVLPIQGGNAVSVGTTLQLSDQASGGVWSVSDPTIASIDPMTGLVTGVSSGTVVITYSVNNLYENFTAQETVTVQ